jgi:hypothetical protein
MGTTKTTRSRAVETVSKHRFEEERRRANAAERELAEARREVTALRDALRGAREHFDERIREAVEEKKQALALALSISEAVKTIGHKP